MSAAWWRFATTCGKTARPMADRRGVWLICAGAVGLWLAAVASSQPLAPAALSSALQAHVKGGRFGIVTSIRGLPLGVRDGLQTLFGGASLDIAEPGAPWQSGDVAATPPLPLRRLIAAGCTAEYCLVHYERGGYARSWHVALFHWTPEATRFEWGGIAPNGLKTLDEVRYAVLSGAIKTHTGSW